MIGIGDFDGKSRNRREVCTREDQVMFMGKKYRRDKKTGYYVCTTASETGNRRRLHVAIWEAEYGVAVPPGCIVHHLDWDKSNNDVKNLVCLTHAEHEAVHNTPGGKELGYELKKTRGLDGLPAGMI